MAETTSQQDADTVLILGAQGFIGTELRRRLAPNYRLLSVDLRPGDPIRSHMGDDDLCREKLFQADLGDTRQIDELWDAIPDAEFSRLRGVIHLAAHYDFKNKPDRRYDRLHHALEHLLQRIDERVPAGVPLLYASSMASMAPTEPGMALTEHSPRLGAWAYPAFKIKAEDVIRDANLERATVELVLAGVYSNLCELVPLFKQIELVRSRSFEKYFYPGPTDRGLTYVHVEEVSRAFEMALEEFFGGRGIERFLIGQESPVTYREIHDRSAQAFYGKDLPLQRIPRALAYLGAKVLGAGARQVGKRRFIQPWMIEFAGEHFEFDLSHTRERLGWSPWRSLHDDLDRILQLAAFHPDVWLEVNEQRPW
ncbi:NAD(P)-dependent oxidoreductase [Persicimonas caeni]|uniref:NAD(P)-dependent oxidoreductase n=1 Tax=Persicimonas caeni TaxID=2292766 RepID=A0A4Y6PMA7_PERCE|nr:NAD(P)-dependent oxidoreductase [Persicimonas caeni]QDG49444.1 NAD(P)-dependent oxidoreductase [Persicimonas caeni]QED30665.1 NAD(P)-dependent oxidoreductase [Persicimonas caeni]